MLESSSIKFEVFDYEKNLPFQIYSIRSSDFSDMDYSKFLPHWHPELELAYVNTTSVHFIDGVRIQAADEDLIITNSMSIHKIELPEESDNIPDKRHAIVMIIHPEWLKAVFPDYGEYVFTNDKRQITDKMRSILEELDRMVLNPEACKGVRYLKLSSLLVSLLYEISIDRISEKSSVHNRNFDARIKMLLKWINQNYMSDLTLESVANRTEMSVSYFCHFFKKHTGMTYHQYLTKVRVLHATQLLVETDDSILDIALTCGFADSRRLSLAFRRERNCSPSEYRKNIRASKK